MRREDAIPGIPTGETDKKKLGDEITVVTATRNMFSTEKTVHDHETVESFQELIDQEVSPYLPELYALAHQVDENEADIPDLRDFIEAWSVEPDCWPAVTSV